MDNFSLFFLSGSDFHSNGTPSLSLCAGTLVLPNPQLLCPPPLQSVLLLPAGPQASAPTPPTPGMPHWVPPLPGVLLPLNSTWQLSVSELSRCVSPDHPPRPLSAPPQPRHHLLHSSEHHLCSGSIYSFIAGENASWEHFPLSMLSAPRPQPAPRRYINKHWREEKRNFLHWFHCRQRNK